MPPNHYLVKQALLFHDLDFRLLLLVFLDFTLRRILLQQNIIRRRQHKPLVTGGDVQLSAMQFAASKVGNRISIFEALVKAVGTWGRLRDDEPAVLLGFQ
jgi:hypothetical protein